MCIISIFLYPPCQPADSRARSKPCMRGIRQCAQTTGRAAGIFPAARLPIDMDAAPIGWSNRPSSRCRC